MKKKKEKLPQLNKASLEKELQRKTAALDKAKRELKIEASLEAVRAVALLMKKREDMLQVCRNIAKQLEILQVKEIRNVQTAIFYEDKGTYTNYEYYAKHDKTCITETVYTNHKIGRSFAAKMLKGNGEYMAVHLKGDEVKDWLAYQKTTNVFIDDYLSTTGSLNYYWFSLGPVALGISTYSSLSKDELNLFRRFLKVFELSYRRYLDIEKAEVQAREAQVEAALEKVRSTSLAIHQSHELEKVVVVLFDNLKELAVPFDSAFIYLFDKSKRNMVAWVASKLLPNPFKVNLPYDEDIVDNPIIADLWYAIESGEHGLNKAYKEKDKDDYFRYEAKYNQSLIPESIADFQLQAESWITSFATEKNSIVGFDSWQLHLTTSEDFQLLKRFAKVFEQAYIRFLDLQKAEAQAREAKIEAALERTRTQSMIMQRSNELDDTLRVFHEQVLLLDIHSAFSFLWLPDEQKERHIFWASWAENNSTVFKSKAINYPLDSNEPATKQCLIDWKGNESVVSYHVPPNGVENYFAAWSELIAGVEQLKPVYFSDGLYYVEAFMKYGCFGVMASVDLTTEEKKTLGRFAIEFERAYTRFLDLQKAEAQAREAQVEAAMESIRSRSLAMHRSDELKEVMAVMFQRLTKLDVLLGTVAIQVFDPVTKDCTFWIGNDKQDPAMVKLPYNEKVISEDNYMRDYWEARNLGQSFFNKVYSYEQKNRYFRYVFANNDEVTIPVSVREYIMNAPSHVNCLISEKNCALFADNYNNQFYTEDQIDVLKRTAKVFDQAYIRFLDLQKAEAQAREAQIEVALERVRSRTMAMFKSDELAETAAILIKQLNVLGIEPISLYIGIMKDNSGEMEIWSTDEYGKEIDRRYAVNVQKNSSIGKIYDAWSAKAKSVVIDIQGQELEDWLVYWREEHQLDFKPGKFLEHRLQNIAYFSRGFIAFTSADKQDSETIQLLERFAAVFNLTYTRFLDLQKAEAQARESQIEAALERVRSVAMGMMKSDDLRTICQSVFTQLPILGFTNVRAAQIYIRDDEEEKFLNYDYSDDTGADRVEVNYNSHPYTRSIYDVIRNAGDGLVHNTIQKKELDEWKAYLYNTLGQQPEPKLETAQELHYYLYSFGIGAFGICTFKAISKDELDILKRFRNVFSLSYQRYSDIALAEAQAREAQIELSLERVRSKTMAMHNSRDVGETAAVMVDELNKLGIETIRCGIGIMHEPGDMEVWTISTDENNKTDIIIGWLDMNMHPLLQGAFESWRNKIENYAYELKDADLLDYYNAINNYPGYPIRYDVSELPGQIQHNEFHFTEGTLFAFSLQQLTDEQRKIFKRFAGVFGQTYRRYLDLQKAEAQGREAIIEAALERVRGRAMAMRNSDDLSSTASAVFTELRKLGIHPIRSGVGIITAASRKLQFYSTASSASGDSLSLKGGVAMYGHPEFEKQYEAWVKQENYFTVLKGKELQSYYAFLFAGFTHPDFDNEDRPEQYGHWLMFSEGFLFAWSEKPYTETEISILDRFKKIVELTFKRYFDLQKSEANARDAVKQASLDRVRAEIASMRTAVDLERITPLIWDELKIIGIPFIRCGVFLMDEQEQQIHTFLSTPNGKAIAAFHLPYDTPGNFAEIVSHWRRKENYVNHWGVTDFMNLAGSLVQQGVIATRQQYINSIPNEGIYLHFLPFLQGMLYVGNEQPLSPESMCLVQNLADAFSTAYARYEDFNKLEAAKEQIEKTLVDLKQAQAQLVQSEKMASLGELTAGIAHEIQNPLNFVNNFSEVSTELIDEMKEEMDKGNSEEARSIAGELKQNLEKINHHGKRAGDIVKGMLQHSRTSSANREPTNINKLADEYLRLAFHGLRSKDKSFNATLITEYDENIGSINIIPQDIGRVLLNLYANAFYAVAEKKKQQPENYEPTVSVRTRHQHDKIELTVEDNGNGIPQKVVDKIFQPFFTTKPTGQGTGLGLSLSYDIIKVHGGEIKVHTSEGAFTAMIIEVPVV